MRVYNEATDDDNEEPTYEDVHNNLVNGNIKDAVELISTAPMDFFRGYDQWLEFNSVNLEHRHRDYVYATNAYFGIV